MPVVPVIVGPVCRPEARVMCIAARIVPDRPRSRHTGLLWPDRLGSGAGGYVWKLKFSIDTSLLQNCVGRMAGIQVDCDRCFTPGFFVNPYFMLIGVPIFIPVFPQDSY